MMGVLILITVCLANVLAINAHCCPCDCHANTNNALVNPYSNHLYYAPPSAPVHHQIANEHQQTSSRLHLVNTQLHQDSPQVHLASQQFHLASPKLHQASPQLHLANPQLHQTSQQLQFTGHTQPIVQNQGHHSSYSNNLQSHLQSGIHQNYQEKGAEASYQNNILSNAIQHQSLVPVQSQSHSPEATHYINIENNSHQSGNGQYEEHHHKKDKDHNIHYKFEYAVNEQKTHDIKRHKEERNGDVVKGEYSLLEGDGNVRTVKYYADWETGFHAQVHNSKKKPLG